MKNPRNSNGAMVHGHGPWNVQTFFKTFVKRLLIKLRTNSSVTKLFSLNNEATDKVLT